jgi:hypothetical protein
MPFVTLLGDALRKLPVRTQVVACCSDDAHVGSEYEVGREVYWWGITGVTRTIDSCVEVLEGSAAKTVFVVETQRAVDISGYWRYGTDEELVVPGVARLRVVSKSTLDGITMVRLREVVA